VIETLGLSAAVRQAAAMNVAAYPLSERRDPGEGAVRIARPEQLALGNWL